MRAYLVYADALGEGGYPRDIRWLAAGLRGQGARVRVVVEMEQRRRGDLEDLEARIEIAGFRELRLGQQDVVHVFGLFLPRHWPVLVQASRVPFVLSPMGHLMPHHLERRRLKKRIALAALKPLLVGVPWWHAFAEPEERAIRAVVGEHVNVFRAGLGVFPAANWEGSACDRPVEGGDGLRLLFFGRNDVFQKGIDILLRGYAAAVREGACVTLTIAGQPWSDSEVILARLVRELGVEGTVRLVGPVSEARRDELFRSHHYLVFLSRWDGPPRPIREAIARGLPVIVSPETNMAEDVLRCDAGLVARLDPADVARAIGEAARLGSAWARHRKGAERLREELSWDNVARRYLDGYERVLSWRTARR